MIGLTGGIGSGKSTVSARLAEMGAYIVDADLIARDVVAKGSVGLREIVDCFGPSVLASDGSLDRDQLARIVFSDEDSLRKLNAITHPLIEVEVKRLIQNYLSLEPDPVVVVVVPLLFETDARRRYGFSKIVVVDLPEEIAIKRLVLSRNMSEEDARRRIEVQISREKRRAGADFVLDNSASPSELDEQVKALWKVVSAK